MAVTVAGDLGRRPARGPARARARDCGRGHRPSRGPDSHLGRLMEVTLVDCKVSALSAEETGKADHPVAANASEEDLVPMWDDLFLSCVRNCFLLEICRVKNSSV